MKLLKELYKIYSPTGREKGMRKFIIQWVKDHCRNTMIAKDQKGNLYITKGKANNFPALCAHMDQVQKHRAPDFAVYQAEDMLFGYSKQYKEYQGLGADDKNGIWVCLKCLEKYDALKVAFFVEEEAGCVGSQKAVMSFFDDCRYVLQIDRKNGGDFITTIGGWTPLCSKEFIEAVQPLKFGYHEEVGLMTDVESLKENGLKVSAANISCGYYNPHTDTEFTLYSELENCLHFVEHIIETCQDTYKHELDAYHFDEYDRAIEEDEYRDIIARHLEENPELTAKDIMEWYNGMFFYLKETDFDRLIQEEKRRSFNY
jgi:putative aminopeptidase FrvX